MSILGDNGEAGNKKRRRELQTLAAHARTTCLQRNPGVRVRKEVEEGPWKAQHPQLYYVPACVSGLMQSPRSPKGTHTHANARRRTHRSPFAQGRKKRWLFSPLP